MIQFPWIIFFFHHPNESITERYILNVNWILWFPYLSPFHCFCRKMQTLPQWKRACVIWPLPTSLTFPGITCLWHTMPYLHSPPFNFWNAPSPCPLQAFTCIVPLLGVLFVRWAAWLPLSQSVFGTHFTYCLLKKAFAYHPALKGFSFPHHLRHFNKA